MLNNERLVLFLIAWTMLAAVKVNADRKLPKLVERIAVACEAK